jgi:hypothetical protein
MIKFIVARSLRGRSRFEAFGIGHPSNGREEAMKVQISALAVAAAMLISSAHAQQATHDPFGTVHFPISCTAVQEKFDRAVALLHNFFYPETVRAFQALIAEDPSCAMSYWGLAMSELPNPLVPPFPPANLNAGWGAIQRGKSEKTQTPREAQYLAAIEIFYRDYDKVDHKTRAERYEQAMQQLHERYPDDSEAAIFYALALNGAVDFDDKNYTKQLKAAAILNQEAEKQPNHPGIAHYLIHSYDFAPLAAMCVSTAELHGKIAPAAPHACICRRTSIRCSACGRIRSAPISPRKLPRKVTVWA